MSLARLAAIPKMKRTIVFVGTVTCKWFIFITGCLHLSAGEGRSGSGPESRTSGDIVGPLGSWADRPQWITMTLHRRTASVTWVASSVTVWFSLPTGIHKACYQCLGVRLVPWWRAAYKRPLTASLRSMLQVGCVLKWKIDIGKRKIFTPQLLHWPLQMT